jgi:hypothetical protein
LARRIDETKAWRQGGITTRRTGALKTHGGWRVVGDSGDRYLLPPDDPDPP